MSFNGHTQRKGEVRFALSELNSSVVKRLVKGLTDNTGGGCSAVSGGREGGVSGAAEVGPARGGQHPRRRGCALLVQLNSPFRPPLVRPDLYAGDACLCSPPPLAGVRATEDAYPAMAAAVGLDPSTGQTIPFSVCNDSKVREALLKP
eukprot:9484023-Pyramimonas_sp.AAC.1